MTETPSTTENAPQAATDDLAPAPEDAPEGTATGYAVYDRTVGQFVGAVTPDKPSRADRDKVTRKGHTTVVVRV